MDRARPRARAWSYPFRVMTELFRLRLSPCARVLDIFAEVLDRFEEAREVGEKYDEFADGHAFAEDEGCAARDYDGGAGGDANVDYRRQRGFDAPGMKGGFDRGFADEFQLLLLEIFAAEGLHDAHRFEALLNGRRRCCFVSSGLRELHVLHRAKTGNEEQQERSQREAISAKSQLSQNMRPTMQTIVRRSTAMPRVAELANCWMVFDIVGNGAEAVEPVWCVS